MPQSIALTGNERTFLPGQVIVTKTDTKGRITYANDVFLSACSLSEKDALGHPHNIIRHPDMPRSIFDRLWTTIARGDEIFAYVVNRATNGDHYWVYAHVTPSINDAGEIIGYHSNRREPDREIVQSEVIPLYKSIKAEEDRHDSPKEGLAAGNGMLDQALANMGMEYDEFICTLGQRHRRGYR